MTVFDFFDGQELTRPNVTPDQAQAIAAELFGITGTVRELGSHQDRNFRIDTPAPHGITSYLLKVDNSAFSEPELEAQDAAMAHLNARGLRVPVPVRGLDGNTRQRWDSGDETLSVRMLTFLDGVPLASQPAFTPEMVSALGALSGTVARELADFDSDGLDRSLQWDLRNAARVVERLASSMQDEHRRELVVRATATAAERLAPLAADQDLSRFIL